MTTPTPRPLFAVYLQGRRAWHDPGRPSCPFEDERAAYWTAGLEDARMGRVDRYRVGVS